MDTEPKTLLHIVPSGVRGGVEKNCFNFAKSMPALSQEIIVLGETGPMVAEWNRLGLKVSVLDILKLNVLEFNFRLKQLLPEGRFEKIIVWTNNRMVLVANALNKYKGATLYFHIGNPVSPGGMKDQWMSLLFPSSNLIKLRAVSEYVLRSVSSHPYYRKFSATVSLKPIDAPDIVAPRPVSLSISDNIRLGMVARLDKIKDHETVIKAFTGIVAQYPNATLEFAGSGPLLESLRSFAASLGIGEKVIFHGDVGDVFSLISTWQIFLYATTPNEGLGGTIPEALSVGLPVVANDLPMNREWDKEGRFIAWCETGNAIDMCKVTLSLIADLERRSFIHKNAHGYIRSNFSPATFSIKYISG